MKDLDAIATVRCFQPRDRAQIEQLWDRVFANDPPWNEPGLMIENKLKVQPELLLVGILDDGVVGAVMAGFDGVRGWLYHLAVAPEHRRRGIATQLVRAAEARVRQLGCPKVNIQVRSTNAEVVAFYRSLGYSSRRESAWDVVSTDLGDSRRRAPMLESLEGYSSPKLAGAA